MENSSDLIGTIIGLIIFVGILALGFIGYRKLLFSTPKRNTTIKKHYLLRDRYKYKRIVRFAEPGDIHNLREQLLSLNFQPISEDNDLWYVKNGSDDFYLHMDYQDKILQITVFAESIFTMTKINLLLEPIFGNLLNG